jgi:hypothetical protein
MFPAKFIGLAFIVMLFLPVATATFQKKASLQHVKLLSAFAFLISVYCFLAGLILYTGWSNPLAGTDPHVLEAAQRRASSELLLLIVTYWPHVLMVWALISALTWGLTFRNALHRAKLAASAI